MMSNFFKSVAFPRGVVVVCVLLLFSPNCRQSSLVRSPAGRSQNGYHPASPGTLSSYIRTVLRISSEKGPRIEQELKRAEEQNPRLARQAEESSAHPGDIQAGLILARSYMEAGLYYPAYEVYQRLAASREPDVRIELGLAEIWDKWQDYALAEEHAEAALEVDSQSAAGWNLLGRIRLHQSDFAGAASSFEKAAALDQSDPVLFANAGYAFLRTDQIEKAETYLEKALSLDGTIVEAHNHLGIVLARQGRYELALSHLTQTCEPAVALSNLGAVLLEEGNREEALRYLHQAAALKPDYEGVRARLADADCPSGVGGSAGVASGPLPEGPSRPVGPQMAEALSHPDRVVISIVPAVAPPARANLDGGSPEFEVQTGIPARPLPTGKEAYRLPSPRADAETLTSPRSAPALYQPALPSFLRSIAAVAAGRLHSPVSVDLNAQALPPKTGFSGLGRSGANPKVTALRWQESLLNPTLLADISVGWSTSPHSDPHGRLYVRSGANLLFCGLLAFAVIVGLLLAGSFRAVVGFSLILAGVAAGLMAL